MLTAHLCLPPDLPCVCFLPQQSPLLPGDGPEGGELIFCPARSTALSPRSTYPTGHHHRSKASCHSPSGSPLRSVDQSSTLSPRPETCPRLFSLLLPHLKLFLLHLLSCRTVGPPAGAPGLRSQPQRSSPVSPSTVTRIFVLKCISDMQPPHKTLQCLPFPSG